MWMWTFARVDLGLSEQEFYRLTLRQFAALRLRQEQRLRQQGEMVELMGAQIVAMIANTGFRGFKSPRQPHEFMPSVWAAERKVKAPKLSRQQKARQMKETIRKYMIG